MVIKTTRILFKQGLNPFLWESLAVHGTDNFLYKIKKELLSWNQFQ